MVEVIDNVLSCPECGEQYLHHESLEIFERNEDAEKCMHITIDGLNVKVGMDKGEANPSKRRHGLAILFRCEFCTNEQQLTIAQHKGMTIVKFEPVRTAL